MCLKTSPNASTASGTDHELRVQVEALSGGGPLFPGTIDMNGVTVINQMHDVLSELIADGFTKIVVMNAHFENEAFIIEAIDLITRETGGVSTIVETNWWDPLPENVSSRCSTDSCSPVGRWNMPQ